MKNLKHFFIRPFLFFICFSSLFLLGVSFPFSTKMVFAQNSVPAEAKDTKSFLNGSIDVFDVLLRMAKESGIEYQKGMLKKKLGVQDGNQYQLVLNGSNFASLERFYNLMRSKWALQLINFSAKPNWQAQNSSSSLEFILEVCLLEHGKPSDPESISSILSPLQNLPFLSAQTPFFTGAQLSGFHYASRETNFHVVASNLEDFLPLFNGSGFSSYSRTLSRSSIWGNNLYNLDLCSDSTLMPTGNLISLFQSLSQFSDLREISCQRSPKGPNQIQLDVRINPYQWQNLIEVMVRKNKYEPVKCEGVQEKGSDWSISFLLKPSLQEIEFQDSEIKNILKLNWPQSQPEFKPTLKMVWTNKTLWTKNEIFVSVEGMQAEKIQWLKPIFEGIGLNFRETRKINSDGNQEPVLAAIFGKEFSGQDESGIKISGSDSLDFFGLGELIESEKTNRGHKYSVKLPFSKMPEFLSAFTPEKNRGVLVEFDLSCTHPDKAKVTIVLSPTNKPPGAGNFNRIIQELTGPKFHWDAPEEELTKGLILRRVFLSADGRITVEGVTLKSKLIFSELFPALLAIKNVTEPFFSQGSYKSHRLGRIMSFVVTARISNLKK